MALTQHLDLGTRGDLQANLEDCQPQDPYIDNGLPPDLPAYPLPPSVDDADQPPYPPIPEITALFDQSAGVDNSQKYPQKGGVALIPEIIDKQGSSKAISQIRGWIAQKKDSPFTPNPQSSLAVVDQ